LGRWSPQSMPIANMAIYRQLFDYLCLASIAISIAEASGGTQGMGGLRSNHRGRLGGVSCGWRLE